MHVSFYITAICPRCEGKGWHRPKHKKGIGESWLCFKCNRLGLIRKKISFSYVNPFKKIRAKQQARQHRKKKQLLRQEQIKADRYQIFLKIKQKLESNV